MFKITVLYPKTATDSFDMDYYLNTHTPMVKTLLEPEGTCIALFSCFTRLRYSFRSIPYAKN
jgi:hypothetical protein